MEAFILKNIQTHFGPEKIYGAWKEMTKIMVHKRKCKIIIILNILLTNLLRCMDVPVDVITSNMVTARGSFMTGIRFSKLTTFLILITFFFMSRG